MFLGRWGGRYGPARFFGILAILITRPWRPVVTERRAVAMFYDGRTNTAVAVEVRPRTVVACPVRLVAVRFLDASILSVSRALRSMPHVPCSGHPIDPRSARL